MEEKKPIDLSKSIEEKALEIRKKVELSDEHNMEFVHEVKGVHYINNSKAVNVEMLKQAIESIEAPIILILGGYDAGNNYSFFSEYSKNKLKAIVYLGNEEEQIIKHYKSESLMFVTAMNIEEAVKVAYWYGKNGDYVLFAPGCPADAFESYKTRGDEFKKTVKALRA